MKCDCLALEVGGELGDEVKTSCNGSIVGGWGPWLVGAKGQYNVDEGKLETNSIGVGSYLQLLLY